MALEWPPDPDPLITLIPFSLCCFSMSQTEPSGSAWPGYTSTVVAGQCGRKISEPAQCGNSTLVWKWYQTVRTFYGSNCVVIWPDIVNHNVSLCWCMMMCLPSVLTRASLSSSPLWEPWWLWTSLGEGHSMDRRTDRCPPLGLSTHCVICILTWHTVLQQNVLHTFRGKESFLQMMFLMNWNGL